MDKMRGMSVQFSLRELFIFVTVAAVAFALVRPFIWLAGQAYIKAQELIFLFSGD